MRIKFLSDQLGLTSLGLLYPGFFFVKALVIQSLLVGAGLDRLAWRTDFFHRSLRGLRATSVIARSPSYNLGTHTDSDSGPPSKPTFISLVVGWEGYGRRLCHPTNWIPRNSQSPAISISTHKREKEMGDLRWALSRHNRQT